MKAKRYPVIAMVIQHADQGGKQKRQERQNAGVEDERFAEDQIKSQAKNHTRPLKNRIIYAFFDGPAAVDPSLFKRG